MLIINEKGSGTPIFRHSLLKPDNRTNQGAMASEGTGIHGSRDPALHNDKEEMAEFKGT